MRQIKRIRFTVKERMTKIPAEIQTTLKRFRRWIRRYILLEGLAVLIAVACLMFWATFLLDVAYFRFSSLELPSTLRLVCLLVMVGVLAGLAISWVLLRLFRQFRMKDLALALERRFPQLRDQLITTVQMEHEHATPLKTSMIERTSREAAAKLSQLPLEETFDQAPLKRLAITATVLFCTLAVFSVANAAGMQRWVHAYIFSEDNYWDPFRQQALTVKIIAQPGEKIKEFDEKRIYKHPRGADLQLLVESHDEAVSPEDVTVQYIAFEGNTTGRGRANMNRFGDGEFRHTFSRVVDDHRLWIRGGDFVNRTPYRIQIVDPPQVDQMTLKCDYPSYTGMDGMEDQLVSVVGTQVSLPMETQIDLQGTCNKPLRVVDIRSGRFQLSFGFNDSETGRLAKSTTLILRDDENQILRTIEVTASAESLLSEDRMNFTVPFLITAQAEQAWEQFGELVELPIPIPPDSALKIFLEDEDDIYSPEPASLTVNGIVDEAPVIDTRRTGVGALVTRNASIPIEGLLADDYGVTDAWFGFKIGSAESKQTRPLGSLPRGQNEFTLNDKTDKKVERFDLRPLKLQEGESLTLAIYAQDGDTLNGPHIAHGEMFSFKVVTDDELLARLFDREVNLRLRFEQIRSEVGDLREILGEQSAIAKTFDEQGESAKTEAVNLSAFVERSLHQLRKNQTESRSIEVSFRDLREEMVNNGIDTKEKLGRIDNGVIAPLSVLNDDLFVVADQRYALQRLSLQRGTGITDAINETVPAIDAVIAQMDRILDEMRDRGTINDLIQMGEKIYLEQLKQLEETEKKRIQENFFFDSSQ